MRRYFYILGGIIEYDASVFANSYGIYNTEFALLHYDVEDLDFAYRSKSLDKLEEYLAYIYQDKINRLNKYHSFLL